MGVLRTRKFLRGRRGFAMAYAVCFMTAMIGFVSLAVDMGKVQTAKMELHSAADAAARAAAANLTNGTTAAQNAAIAMAAQNKADNSTVTITTSDIEFINWVSSSNYSVVGSSASANAVRVYARRTAANGNAVALSFGSVIGMPSCNVNTSAIAMAASTASTVSVGLNGVTLSNHGSIDSYNSTVGSYNSSSANQNAVVQSNGIIDINNNSVVYGDANPGHGQSVTPSGNSYVTGSIAPLASTVSYANAALPSSYTTISAINLTGNNTLNLSAGTYYTPSLKLAGNATVTTNGQVSLYVGGSIDMSGHSALNQNTPANLNVYATSAQTIKLDGNSQISATLYAPQSDVTISNSADFFGAVIGNTLTIKSNAGLHYDEAMGTHANIKLVK